MIFYTDGVGELEKEGKKLHDRRFVKVLLEACKNESATEIVRDLKDRLLSYHDQPALFDDLTFVVLTV